MSRAWLLALAPLAAPLGAQVAWTQMAVDADSERAVAFDPVQQRPMLYGARRRFGAAPTPFTAHWDGTNWIVDHPRTSPTIREGHALVTDLARNRVVLFGGERGSETWTWDGTDWTRRNPSRTPPGRSNHAMVWDAGRARVVLCGGFDGAAGIADTWEWDGTDWTQRSIQPPARFNHRLAYDATRQRVVLFGGKRSDGVLFGDTWTWDGNSWTHMTPTTPPPYRHRHGFAPDPGQAGRLLLTGGSNEHRALGDQWSWDGSNWAPRPSATIPLPNTGHALIEDPVRGTLLTLVSNHEPQNYVESSTWEWNGTDWRLLSPGIGPGRRSSAGMAFDSVRGVSVMFGGENDSMLSLNRDTQEWNGTTWVVRQAASGLGGRRGSTLGFDPARRRTVLHGGSGFFQGYSDTWEWDGNSWVQIPTTLRPGRLLNLTYDWMRGRLVGFEGRQLWEWDGISWTQRVSATSPAGGFVTCDRVRQRLVAFYPGTSETWEWQGQDWVPRSVAVQPPPSAFDGFFYDPARRRSLLVENGGYSVWEWDGVSWLRRLPGAIRASLYAAAAFDERRGRLVVSGGVGEGGLYGDTWEYSPIHPAAVTSFGSGCAGPAGAPLLGPLPGDLPWLGDVFRLQLTTLPSGTPVLLWLGVSRTALGPMPLPLDLGGLGLPGCMLRTSSDLAIPLRATAGHALLPLVLPTDASLLGAAAFGQGAALDPGANAVGLTLSQGLELRFGGK